MKRTIRRRPKGPVREQLSFWIEMDNMFVLPVPIMAAGRANTPEPAISPARKMEAVMIPRPCFLTSSTSNFSAGAPAL